MVSRADARKPETDLPCGTRGLVVRVLFFHGSIDLTYGEALLGAAEDGTAEDDRQGMLWAAVGIRQTGEGIGAIWVWLVGTHDDVGLGIIIGLCSSTLVCHRVGWRRLWAGRGQLLGRLLLLPADSEVRERKGLKNVVDVGYAPHVALLAALWVEEAVEGRHGGRARRSGRGWWCVGGRRMGQDLAVLSCGSSRHCCFPLRDLLLAIHGRDPGDQRGMATRKTNDERRTTEKTHALVMDSFVALEPIASQSWASFSKPN